MKKTNRNLLALLAVLVLLLCVLSGCSAAPKYATEDAAGAEMPQAMAEPEAEPMPAPEEYEVYKESLTTDASTSDVVSTPKNLSEKIIYSADLYMETLEFDPAIAAVEAMVEEFDGFIERSEINGRTEYHDDGTSTLEDRSAYYVLRIPCARFNEFLKRSGDIGNVLSSNTYAENITSQFTDAEARKDSLLIQEERLMAMMEETTEIESLITLEARLSEVRYEIEALERQLINWQNMVDYSTVSLSLQEVAIYTPVVPVQRSFGDKLSTAFADGWNRFVDFAADFVLWFAASLPVLVVLALIALAIILIVTRINRKARKKNKFAYPDYTPPKNSADSEPSADLKEE